MLKRITGALIALGTTMTFVAPAAGQSPEPADQQQASSQPNVLVVVVDDQASSLFNRTLMPQVFSEIVDKGVNFDRAYVNTSQCCPSRAQIMTGLYGHQTGVDGNQVPLTHPTLAEVMKDRGYATAIAGKYLNSWPCEPRAEFDLWACIRGSTEHASLVNPDLNINGRKLTKKGYQTEVLSDLLLRFIKKTPTNTPFFAMYTTTSPHMPANDRRYKGLEVPSYRPPSFDEDTLATDKPVYAQRDALTQQEIDKIDVTYRKMARATRALDDSVARLVEGLGTKADNTIIFYISDNGYLYGEHRMTKKIVPYEESVNVPFAVRYPALGGAAGVTSQALVQNVDIAATVADLLGFDWGASGRSLLPLLTDPADGVRDAALIENCQGRNFPCEGTAPRGSRRVPSFWGVVTDRHKYVEYYTGDVEMYDLLEDPFELNNLAGDQAHVALRGTLAARLLALRTPPAPDTTIVSGPPTVSRRDTVSFRYFTESHRDRYQCRVTSGSLDAPWLLCTAFERAIGPLADGDYVFEVRGMRGDTVVDLTPASRAFSVRSSPVPSPSPKG